MSDEPRRILKKGEAFYEKHGAIHIWSSNASDTTVCKVVASIFGRPGEPFVTYVEGYARETREEALEMAKKGI